MNTPVLLADSGSAGQIGSQRSGEFSGTGSSFITAHQHPGMTDAKSDPLIMQKMDTNSAAATDTNTGAGSAGAAAADAPDKSSKSYEEFRPAMAAAITRAATDGLDKQAESTLLAKARDAFKQEATEDISELDLHYLSTDVLRRLKADGVLRNRRGAGAAKKLSDEDAERACELLIRGNGQEGVEFRGYTSLAHALADCEELRRIKEDSGVNTRTLKSRIKKAHKAKYKRNLKKITIRYKPKLTDEVKAERLAAAMKWRLWSLSELWNIVWIDEKTEWLRPSGSYRCYAPPGTGSFAREGSAPLGKAPKLKYEAAVCGWAGPLYFKAITGTTGLQQGYRVRTVPLGADLDPPRHASCLPCCV